MARWNVAEKNGMWKGGRSVASNGYVLIRVGTDHHLADVRGYAYEHRLVAEEKIGRRLLENEQIHHVDHDKQNNDPSNLEVTEDSAHHHVHHRGPGGDRLRLPDEPNRTILCGCGCGDEFTMFDETGRPRRFISGHNSAPAPTEAEVIKALAQNPASRVTLAATLSKSVQAVATALSRLKRKGIVDNDVEGVWRIGAWRP